MLAITISGIMMAKGIHDRFPNALLRAFADIPPDFLEDKTTIILVTAIRVVQCLRDQELVRDWENSRL